MTEHGKLLERIARRFNEQNGFDFREHLGGAAFMGSVSHNTYVPPTDPNCIDDIDVMGIILPPAEYVMGLESWDHWTLREDDLDCTFYSLRKFVSLLLKANPNVVGLLWLRPEFYINRTPALNWLIEERSIFSSRFAYRSFVGYAMNQVHRMQNMAYEGYMGEKRKALVNKFGYDCKNAAHAIRLMRMCIDFLRTGRMKVYRDVDAEYIRAIKRGEWTLEQVKTAVDDLVLIADDSLAMSTLPEMPDRKRATELLLGLTWSSLTKGQRS